MPPQERRIHSAAGQRLYRLRNAKNIAAQRAILGLTLSIFNDDLHGVCRKQRC